MDSPSQMTFEDAVFKLINFDDKLHIYNQPAEVSPHLAFHTRNGRGYSSRGRGNFVNRGGFRGSGSYSTRGRGFQQRFSGSSGSNSR